MLLSYLYCSCILRHATLLFSIWSAKGWGPLAFTTILQAGPTAYLPPTLSLGNGDNTSTLERLSAISKVSRCHISTILSQAHGPWLLHLGAGERIAVLEAVASMYSCLGYRRKEAYILREVLGCLLDLLVCGRDEDGALKTAQAISGGGIANGAVAVRINESSDGNGSLLKLLIYVSKVLGIDLTTIPLHEEKTTIPERRGDITETYEEFGWPELQVGVIREAVAVAEALPGGLVICAVPDRFRSYHQRRFYVRHSIRFVGFEDPTANIISRRSISSTFYSFPGTYHSQAAGCDEVGGLLVWRSCCKYIHCAVSIPYPCHPFQDLSSGHRLPLIRLPIETPIVALQAKAIDVQPILTGATDPFLYNPRRALTTQVNDA